MKRLPYSLFHNITQFSGNCFILLVIASLLLIKMEAIQVYRDDFDNMENHSPEYSELLGTFIEKEGKTAHGNASMFISNIKPINIYLGYDGNVYPKFRLVKIHIS